MTNQELRSLASSTLELNADQLIFILEEIGARGDVMMYKHDGERAHSRYTVLIILIGQEGLCRRDGKSLSDCVKGCFSQYLVKKPVPGED